MSARVTRKRARMDAEQAEEDGASASTSSASGHGDSQARPGNFEQDPELWFQDGTIILVAGEIAFKVYKGPLVNQSPVFSDMLSLPQPSVDVHQDCPVVQLLDSPQDLRHFLRTLIPSKHPR
ncbi:hypothetical protein OH76DRAFT_614497 [Lentinus brumalis]|uniref:BTB domain-containing protein n=1 Tax=Lentinus brumalis TaxID=2498619 RepID=A0A371D8V5_9APHY|nr:hypothetical protein OH76DRAFT_614497 [Polyporus brumalis]